MSEPQSMTPMLVRYAAFGVVCAAAVALFAPAPQSPAPAPLPKLAPTSACDLGAGPCAASFDDGAHDLTLELGPRPLKVVSPLTVRATFGRPGSRPVARDVTVTLMSTTMEMGVLRVPLVEAGDAFTAPTALPLCTTARMQWLARLEATLDGEVHAATFGFLTDRSATPAAPHTVDVAGAAPFERVAARDVAFTVLTAAGPLSLSALRGQLVLVQFGFASCPDVCPMGLAALSAGLKLLADDERARVKVVFVSLDPARDQVQDLATYGRFFHPDIIAGTGSEADVAAAAATFGVAWQKVPTDDGSYVIDHAAFTSFVAADGRLVGRLAHAAAPGVTADAIRAILATQEP